MRSRLRLVLPIFQGESNGHIDYGYDRLHNRCGNRHYRARLDSGETEEWFPQQRTAVIRGRYMEKQAWSYVIFGLTLVVMFVYIIAHYYSGKHRDRIEKVKHKMLDDDD